MGYIERNRRKIASIYEEYKDDVYKVCLYFTKDYFVAQELAQQVFFNFYQHIDQIEMESVRGYLIRAARNTSFNYLRDLKYEQVKGSWETLDEESATVISVEEIYFRNEQKQQEKMLSSSILERLKQENMEWYTAMNLVYCLGKPHEVVADELGISKDALYSLIYRAKKWIRKNYESQYDDVMIRS